MHMILRTLWAFICKRFLTPMSFDGESVITMRVLPTDLDVLWHVNNGVYFSYMDFGRWDLIFRNGLFDLLRKNDMYAVVSGESMRFKRSLKLWDKFTLKTKVMGRDDKYFFINQYFYSQKGDLMATGLVKIRYLHRKHGVVSPEKILELAGSNLPIMSKELSDQAFDFEQSFLK